MKRTGPIQICAIGAALLCAAASGARAEGERRLLDQVVAVVEAQTITLSELEAETRIRLAEARGPEVAVAPLDRPLLAASLRRLIQERVVLAEVERLRLYDLDHTEVEAALARLRARFVTPERFEAFTRSLEMTEEEVSAVLGRGIRVASYLNNRLKLAAQLRESELDDAARALGGTLTRFEREALREKLARQKYERMLTDLLADLRRRASVRVIDALESPAAAVAQPGKPG